MRYDVGPKGIHGLQTRALESIHERGKQVAFGLRVLQFEYYTEICTGCMGSGNSSVTFGHCTWCNGVGIVQLGGPAPASVLNQVLEAGAAYKIMEK